MGDSLEEAGSQDIERHNICEIRAGFSGAPLSAIAFIPGDGPRRRLSGARHGRYRCSLPGLAGFAGSRRGETDVSRH